MHIKPRERIILTDCDGVLVWWDASFTAFMTAKGFPRIPGTEHCYNISDRHGVSMHQAAEFVKEFNNSEAVANMPPFADAVEYVKKLADKGFRFIVVTSLSDKPIARQYRTVNLMNLFGDVFDEIVCLYSGAHKDDELARWRDSRLFWIEDHTRQALAGYEVGLKPVIIDHPYNSHFQTDLFPRVSYQTPWKEIYNMVCDDYGIDPS